MARIHRRQNIDKLYRKEFAHGESREFEAIQTGGSPGKESRGQRRISTHRPIQKPA